MESTPAPSDDAADFTPVPVRPRHDGWTAERQRGFIEALAERGCISDACLAVGLTPKSAYRLRHHPDGAAFAEAWDRALMLSTTRLVAIAFDRAVQGNVREVWRNGECVGEMRAPSDRLLMFLLSKLDPRRFGSRADLPAPGEDPVAIARTALPGLIDRFTDSACTADRLAASDFDSAPLLDEHGVARKRS